MLNKINDFNLNPTMFKKTQFKFREVVKNLGIYKDT